MALTLPGISGGQVTIRPAMYPMTQSNAFATSVVTFMNGQRQVWANRTMLQGWQLEYTQLADSDRVAMDAFLVSTLGGAATWTFARGGPNNVSVPYCQFIEDSFTWTKTSMVNIGSWDGSIRFQQVANGGAGATNAPALNPTSFPLLGPAPGYVTGYPFVRVENYACIRQALPTGGTIITPLYGAGITGYPTRALYSWTLTFTVLSDADLAILQAHFFSAGGRYATFSFTDPTLAKTFTKVAYASDTFDVKYQMKGISSVTIQLEEVFGPGWTA